MMPVRSPEASRSSSRGTTPHRGATSFQMIAVLLSFGILAAIALPEASRMLSRQRLRAAAELTRRAIEETVALAETSGSSQELIFVVGASQLHVPGRLDPRSGSAPWTIDLSQVAPSLSIESSEFGPSQQPFMTFRNGGRTRSNGKAILRSGDLRIDLLVIDDLVQIGETR